MGIWCLSPTRIIRQRGRQLLLLLVLGSRLLLWSGGTLIIKSRERERDLALSGPHL